MNTLDELRDGAKAELRERFNDFPGEFDGGEPHDVIHEIADSSVPVYNVELVELAGIPEVGHHETELPPAFDGTPTIINVAATAVFELLEAALWDEWREIEAEKDEEN